MRSIANGISINYEITGEGPPVILIHGLAMDMTFWDLQVPALDSRFKTIRYDVRGHGNSEQTEPPYSLDLLADDLHHFIRSIGVEAAHLVGLSMGGMVAQTFALSHPSEVLSLTLSSTTSDYQPEIRETFRQRGEMASESGMSAVVDATLARWFSEDFRQNDSLEVRKVRRVVLGTNPSCFGASALAVSQVSLTSRLSEIEQPTLVIAADNDAATPVAFAKVIHEQIAGSALGTVIDASHCCNIEQPDQFNKLLLDFLLGLSSHEDAPDEE